MKKMVVWDIVYSYKSDTPKWWLWIAPNVLIYPLSLSLKGNLELTQGLLPITNLLSLILLPVRLLQTTRYQPLMEHEYVFQLEWTD